MYHSRKNFMLGRPGRIKASRMPSRVNRAINGYLGETEDEKKARLAAEAAGGGVLTLLNPIVGMKMLYGSFLGLFKNKADADREARVAAFKEKYSEIVNYIDTIGAKMAQFGYPESTNGTGLYDQTIPASILRVKQLLYYIRNYVLRFWNMHKDTGSLTQKCLAWDWLNYADNVGASIKSYPSFYGAIFGQKGKDALTDLTDAVNRSPLTAGGGGPGTSSGVPSDSKNPFVDSKTGKLNYVMIGGVAVGVAALATLTGVLMKRRNANA